MNIAHFKESNVIFIYFYNIYYQLKVQENKAQFKSKEKVKIKKVKKV